METRNLVAPSRRPQAHCFLDFSQIAHIKAIKFKGQTLTVSGVSQDLSKLDTSNLRLTTYVNAKLVSFHALHSPLWVTRTRLCGVIVLGII
jgi:Tfp pilus assembly protein PilN